MFSVDYETLSQIIQQFLYTGIFRAQIVASRSFPEEGHIELHVREGVIYACFFITAQKQMHKWENWETHLARFGALNWELTQQHSVESTSQTPSSISPSLSLQPQTPLLNHSVVKTPSHRVSLSASELARWPILYRHVYSLIDGKRQPSDIALVLHKSEQEIVKIIDDLYVRGLIQLR
jgi:hypothetical protein